jgi:hypothetical protein
MGDVVGEVDLWAPYGAQELRTLLRWAVGALVIILVAKVLGLSAGALVVLLFPSAVMLKFVSLYPPLHGRVRVAVLLLIAVLLLPAIIFDYGWLSDFSTEPQGAPITWALLIVVGLLLVCAWLIYAVIRLRNS